MKTKYHVQKILILICFFLVSGSLSAWGGLQFGHKDTPKPAQNIKTILTALLNQEDPEKQKQLLKDFQRKTIIYASAESVSIDQPLSRFDILRIGMAIESINFGADATVEDYLARDELIRQIDRMEDLATRQRFLHRLEEKENE